MTNWVVDILLALAVLLELACVAGVLFMPTTFDRLHYVGAAPTVPAFLVLAAVLCREHLSSGGLEAIAAVLAEIAVARTDGRAPLPAAVLKGVPSALGMVFVDFAIVMVALLRRRPGVMRRTPFGLPDEKPFRTWAAIVGDWSPNAYVVDIADGVTTSHHLVEHEPSRRPA